MNSNCLPFYLLNHPHTHSSNHPHTHSSDHPHTHSSDHPHSYLSNRPHTRPKYLHIRDWTVCTTAPKSSQNLSTEPSCVGVCSPVGASNHCIIYILNHWPGLAASIPDRTPLAHPPSSGPSNGRWLAGNPKRRQEAEPLPHRPVIYHRPGLC